MLKAIRHAFVREHEDTGLPGIQANSTDQENLALQPVKRDAMAAFLYRYDQMI